jgi:hypothetical protein
MEASMLARNSSSVDRQDRLGAFSGVFLQCLTPICG